MVIYVDVVFIVNFFITFFLLQLTAKLSKTDEKLWRIVLGSLLGGLYSLVILADDLSFLVSILGKFVVGCLIVLASFRLRGIKNYFKEVLIFFFANLMFVGIIIGTWMIFKPKGVVINNSTVYFDISAKLLLFSALCAYLISVIIIRIYNNKIAKKELYQAVVSKNGREYKFFAFADSGNNLKEPFSNAPVIIADKSLFDDIETERLVPYSTIGGEGVLNAFKPDKTLIITSRGQTELCDVYVALNDNLKKGEYRGIINPKILNER